MSTRTAPSPLDAAVCFALYSSTQATLQLYRDLLAPWGLTYQQALVLTLLWHDGAQSPGALATRMHLDASTVSGLIGRMERDGLVTRSPSPDDRRGIVVATTAAADRLRPDLEDVFRCVARGLQLDADGAQTLLTALHAVRDAARQAPRDLTTPPSATRKDPS